MRIGCIVILVLVACALGSVTCERHITDLSSSGVYLTRLHGNFTEMFLYWLDIQVGNPPKKFTVAFDTGSSDTLVPRVGCENCIPGSDPWFVLVILFPCLISA